MDGWMTWDFTSFSTVFQSYQDDRRLKMNGCVQWNSILWLRRFCLECGSKSVHLISRPELNLLSYQGPVVQSIISLTRALRDQLFKCFTTL